MKLELLVNKSLLLREFVESDAAALAHLVAQEQQALCRWFGWSASLANVVGATTYLRVARAEQNQSANTNFGIFLDEKLIGGISFQNYHAETKRVNIGYWVAATHQRQGIAGKCLRQVLAYLFDSVGLEKVEAYVLPANTASIALLLNLGFKTEGLLRKWQYLNGGLQDTYVFGILAEEWGDYKLSD